MAKHSQEKSRKKKLTDGERIAALLNRVAQRAMRSEPVKELIRRAERGEEIGPDEIRRAGLVPRLRPDGGYDALPDPFSHGPIRTNRVTKIRDLQSGEITEINWENVEVLGMDNMVHPWPLFIDLSTPSSDVAALFRSFFLAAQQTAKEHEMIGPVTRSIRAYDAELLRALDVYRQIAAADGGRQPSFASLARELGVTPKTAKARLERAQEHFADRTEAELSRLISEQRSEMDRGQWISGGSSVPLLEDLDSYDACEVETDDFGVGLEEADYDD